MSGHRPTRPFGLNFRLGLARLVLLWECVWPAVWPALGVCGLFLLVALFDVLPLLPGWLHGLVLAAFVAALGWALKRAVTDIDWPTLDAAQRRLEKASALEHRPLTLVEDTLGSGQGDPAAQELWAAHRRRMLARMGALKLDAPRPGLPRRDPWALRGGLLVALVVAVTVAWGDSRVRLERAFVPELAALGARGPASLEVWITPPAYTGMAPRFLRFGAAAADPNTPQGEIALGVIEVPAGSVMMAQLYGGRGTPHLRVAGEDSPFSAIAHGDGARTFQMTREIDRAGRITVLQGGSEVGAWTVAIAKDGPPRIAFSEPPVGTPRASLRLEYTAEDDFGVVEATATIRRAQSPAGGLEEPPIELKLPLPGGAPKTARSTGFHDLSAHIWAGLPVQIQLGAQDATGQTGQSDVVEMVLPEREFHNRLAKLLVEARKQLAIDSNKTVRRNVARMAAQRALRPMDYGDDIVVFLALKSVHDRLLRDNGPETIGEIQQLLWDTALRIEDGETMLAERALRDAEEALRDALDRDVDDAELQTLLDQLQKALDDYFQALAQDMQRNPEKYQGAMPLDPDTDVMEVQDLQRLLDQIREMATTGAKDAARQMLSQLREMLENLRAGRPGQAQQGQNQAQQMMNSLDGLARKQRELLDQTFEDAQRSDETGQQGKQPGASDRAAQQEALRRELGEIMRQLGEMSGEIPEGLGKAERAMRDARRALEKGQPGQALGPQGEALEQLRAGTGEAMRQMARQFGRQFGLTQGGRQNRRGNRDPLGRPYDSDGNAWGSDIQVPESSDVQRARQILDELRRRSGEGYREPDELDYIDRLLRRF